MAKYGAMVIGPGWVAGEHIKGYCKDPRTEIRAIVGMVPEDRSRAEQYMKQFNFRADYYDSLDAALKRDDIHVASVCTINFLHYEQTVACLQAGKHVMVEKPLCFTQQQNKHLRDLARQTGLRTQVGHVCRFYPAVVGLKNFVDAGHIGEVFYVEADYWHEIKGAWKGKKSTGGSALLMGGCHAVDLVRWFAGENNEIVEVSAMSEPARWRKDFEYDPTIVLTARFANGTIGKCATSLECNMPYVFHLQVNGSKGTIRNNGVYSEALFPGSRDFTKLTSTYPDDWNVGHHPFPEEISAFLDTIDCGRDGMLSIPNAYKTYELVFAAEKSAEERAPVKLPL